MTIVNDLLKIKGNHVWGVSPSATVLQALKYMAEKDIGALLVVEEHKAAAFAPPEGFEELERRAYDDTEFTFLRFGTASTQS